MTRLTLTMEPCLVFLKLVICKFTKLQIDLELVLLKT